MIPAIDMVEKATLYSSVLFCLSLFFMLVRMKMAKVFDLKDHVPSTFSFDLDLKIFTYIKAAYGNHYKSMILPFVNLWSFVAMVSGIFILSL